MIRVFLIVSALLLSSLAAVAAWVYWQIPNEDQIKGCLVTKMYQVNLCPGSKDYVPLRSISPFLQKAVVMSEDSMFWQHKGFDWESLEKSARENWESGTYKRGGSTISQQLAKNMFLSRDKTLIRKGIEALITMKIEKTLNKKEILERYLNVVEFGKDTFGVKKAAWLYFKKSPGNLTLVESAFLTMLLPSPVKYARSHHQKSLTPFAARRIHRIISDLARTGRVSEEEADTALAQMSWFLGGEPPPPPEDSELTLSDDNELSLEGEPTQTDEDPQSEEEPDPR